jgi:hypothetical protein
MAATSQITENSSAKATCFEQTILPGAGQGPGRAIFVAFVEPYGREDHDSEKLPGTAYEALTATHPDPGFQLPGFLRFQLIFRRIPVKS